MFIPSFNLQQSAQRTWPDDLLLTQDPSAMCINRILSTTKEARENCHSSISTMATMLLKIPVTFLSLPAELRIKVYKAVITAVSESHITAFANIRFSSRQIKHEFDHEYIEATTERYKSLLARIFQPMRVRYICLKSTSFRQCLVIHLGWNSRCTDNLAALHELNPFVHTIHLHYIGSKPVTSLSLMVYVHVLPHGPTKPSASTGKHGSTISRGLACGSGTVQDRDGRRTLSTRDMS